MTVNATQHGGDHYKADYQHWDLVADLQLNYYVANATKYITRHRKKNGREDVLKAGHYLDKLIELIENDRMPAPVEPPHLVMIARGEMLNRFFDANNIDVEGSALEAQFLTFTVNAISTADLRHSRALVGHILAQQYPNEKAALAPRPEGLTNVPVHIAAAMDSRFGPEGYWGDGRVLWKCRVCNAYFQALDGVVPSAVHQCAPAPADDGSEATPAYVDQDR